ncbi:hypothetical protein [Microcystis aeruginosa]|uniref:hypothetical protein n=1 Tax=Microcystis aeruginosa TaxID=1126 RepID=UPI001882082A|nr:hypothetical protein [Microcystis aeruginosa]MBE8996162.1 hypothetical protein [Microcystis aeruginosa LEGE 91341]
MARDKLITIRIEGEKRDLFNQLAKSQNTDTASLLYDFINQCLSGQIDISLVTGKGNRLDNQIDSDRIDKLETATQRLDNWIGALSGRLNDWIEAFDDRLNDCDQGLSGKIFSIEHRLNALAIQLDSQKDSQETTTQEIDTDSQKDSQRIDDMEYLLKREKECSIASIDGTVETVEPISTIETVASAIETVTVDSDSSIETVEGGGMNAAQAYRYLAQKEVKVSERSLSNWANKGIPTTDKGDKVSEHLILRDKLYYPVN